MTTANARKVKPCKKENHPGIALAKLAHTQHHEPIESLMNTHTNTHIHTHTHTHT